MERESAERGREEREELLRRLLGAGLIQGTVTGIGETPLSSESLIAIPL